MTGIRRGSKPSTPMLLSWGMVLLLSFTLTGLVIQAGCSRKKRETVPQTQQEDTADSVQPQIKKPQPDTPAHATAPKKDAKKEPVQSKPLHPKQSKQLKHPPPLPREPQHFKPRIALVIDDLGQAEPELVQRLCSMNIPLTVAILPFLPHSKDSARIANSKGMEVILHMPMEPVGYPAPNKRPGPGAVLFEQSEEEVRKKTAYAMLNIPHAAGMNNHMGSRITPDHTRMGWILEEVKKSNWYFLDSRTEKDTSAMEVARTMGIPTLERKVFLDDKPDTAEMTRQWERALAMAKHDRYVVVIGHIHTETIAFLEKAVAEAKDEVAFVKASVMAR